MTRDPGSFTGPGQVCQPSETTKPSGSILEPLEGFFWNSHLGVSFLTESAEVYLEEFLRKGPLPCLQCCYGILYLF
jgi:hypothetical protein